MDLSTLRPVEGETMELLHPVTREVITDEKGKAPKPFTINLIGADSNEYRALVKKAYRSDNNKKKVDFDDLERKNIESLARATKGCFLILDKKEVECTFENMVKVYTEFMWIREQVSEFIHDRANFIKS